LRMLALRACCVGSASCSLGMWRLRVCVCMRLGGCVCMRLAAPLSF
jgi:hypothetical protein